MNPRAAIAASRTFSALPPGILFDRLQQRKDVEDSAAVGAHPAVSNVEERVEDEAGGGIKIDHASVPVPILHEPAGLHQAVVGGEVRLAHLGLGLVKR